MIEWIYLAGYLITLRYTIGFLLHGLAGGYRVDGVDIFMCSLFGAIVNVFWPFLVMGRVVYIVGMKFGVGPTSFESIFPAPKDVETRAERRARREREHHEEVRALRRRINDNERELGMQLSTWD